MSFFEGVCFSQSNISPDLVINSIFKPFIFLLIMNHVLYLQTIFVNPDSSALSNIMLSSFLLFISEGNNKLNIIMKKNTVKYKENIIYLNMNSRCEDIINEIYKEKKNNLMSFPDVVEIELDKLIPRLFVTTYDCYVSFPNLNQNFVFSDHNLSLSLFDILKELSNISILYLFSEYIEDILSRKIGYALYYDIKCRGKFENMDIITPFIIYLDNNIKIVKLKKYSKYHYIINLPKVGTSDIVVKSNGFLLSDNVNFDNTLSKKLSESFNIDEEVITKEYNNYKPLKKKFVESKPFYVYGYDNRIVFNISHYFDIDFEKYKNDILNIISNIFDIIEEKIVNFDYSLYIYIYNPNNIREKFNKSLDKNYESLYIDDVLLSQVFSCLMLSNGFQDGENYFIKDKNSEIDINNLLGLVKKHRTTVKDNMERYFELVKKLYD